MSGWWTAVATARHDQGISVGVKGEIKTAAELQRIIDALEVLGTCLAPEDADSDSSDAAL